jgi:lysophospholipase L1-like esterase
VRLSTTALRLTLLAACLPLITPPAAAQAQPHWVATWGTAPVARANDHHAFTMPTTLRQIVHVSLGGSTIRVVLTNELGVSSLVIDEAAAALPATSGAIQPNSSVPLTFNGHSAITIPPGAIAISDPIPFNLAPLTDLAISLSIAGQAIPTLTQHDLSLETNYIASFDQVTDPTLKDAATTEVWDFIKGVEVESPPSATIVAFGDSITDGWHSTSGTHNTWPDLLAARLQANPATRNLAVINEGIGGNRVLHDGWGPNALARFDSDVLAPSGVKYVILLESINDIGHAYDPAKPYDIVSADDLITGLSQLAARAHAHNLKVIGATLTPYMGAGYSSPAGDAVRNAVNQWIRTTNLLDGVIDFDKATRDPANPSVFLPAADSGDHLHPNDAGFHRMADSIDLTLFTK